MEVQRDEEGRVVHEPPKNPHPPKGILKNMGEVHHIERKESGHARWNEAVLEEIEKNKDYGTMKIDEPKTPYHAPDAAHLDDLPDFDLEGEVHERRHSHDGSSGGDWSSDDEESKNFKAKRAAHYNEGRNLKLARELLKKELADLKDE